MENIYNCIYILLMVALAEYSFTILIMYLQYAGHGLTAW
jgi:hypothetical protein